MTQSKLQRFAVSAHALVIPAVGYFVLLLWVYRAVWSVNGVDHGFGWDAVDEYGPDLEYAARELGDKGLSLWNPYDRGGYPLFADPEFQRWYPVAWLFNGIGAVFGAGGKLITYKLLAHQWIAAFGLYCFLTHREVRKSAAFVGGTILLCSLPMIVHKASLIVHPVVWVPWVWLAIDWLIRSPSLHRGILLGAVGSLVITAGSPPGWWYAFWAIAPFFVVRFADTVRKVDSRRVLFNAALAAVLLFAAMTLCVLLPSRELVALAARNDFNGVKWATDNANTIREVLPAVFAPLSGLHQYYLGVCCLWFVLLALVLHHKQRKLCYALVFGGLFALLLLSGDTEILGFAAKHVPGFDLFRAPPRYKLISAICLATVAAFGANALLNAATTKRVLVATALTVTIATASFFVDKLSSGSVASADISWFVTIAASLLLVAALALELQRRGLAQLATLASLLWVVVISVDAPQVGEREFRPTVIEPVRKHDHDHEILSRLAGLSTDFRVWDEFLLSDRPGMRHDIRELRSYPALNSLTDRRWTLVMKYAKKDPAILTDFNVKWLLVGPHHRFDYGAALVRSVLEPVFAQTSPGIFVAASPAPLVNSYDVVRLAANEGQVLPLMRAQELGVHRLAAVMTQAELDALPADVAKQIVVMTEREQIGRAGIPGKVTSYGSDRIEATVPNSKHVRLIATNELWYPGWRVWIDGVPGFGFRCNLLMRCVVANSAAKQIVWEFVPKGYLRWRKAALAGYFVCLLSFGLCLLRRKRRDVTAA